MLLPRFRPQYPGGGLPAFIVVAFVFFFGMLTAVEVFGAEEKEGGEHVAETTAEPTATTTQPTTTQQATSRPGWTSRSPSPSYPWLPRRGGRAVECGGLENRFGLLGPTRVQIPPPPLRRAKSRRLAGGSERSFPACSSASSTARSRSGPL